MAGSNSARYLDSKKEINIPGSELFDSSNVRQETVDINGTSSELEWFDDLTEYHTKRLIELN
jgi:hypothetical protein